MNAPARLPRGGAEHHQIYASTNVRKTLDTTLSKFIHDVIAQNSGFAICVRHSHLR